MMLPKSLTIRAADTSGKKTDIFEGEAKVLNIMALDTELLGRELVQVSLTVIAPPIDYEGPATIQMYPSVEHWRDADPATAPYVANVHITSAGRSPNTVRVEVDGETLADVAAISIHLAYGRHDVTISRVNYLGTKAVTT